MPEEVIGRYKTGEKKVFFCLSQDRLDYAAVANNSAISEASKLVLAPSKFALRPGHCAGQESLRQSFSNTGCVILWNCHLLKCLLPGLPQQRRGRLETLPCVFYLGPYTHRWSKLVMCTCLYLSPPCAQKRKEIHIWFCISHDITI